MKLCENNAYGIFCASAVSDLIEPFKLYCPGKKFCDLGAGDGRVLTLAYTQGADVMGYELAPRKRVFSDRIVRADFMKVNLKEHDILYYYLKGSNKEKTLIEKVNGETKDIFMLYTRHCNDADIDYFIDRLDLELLDQFGNLYVFRQPKHI